MKASRRFWIFKSDLWECSLPTKDLLMASNFCGFEDEAIEVSAVRELENEAGYQKKRADSLLEFTEKLKFKNQKLVDALREIANKDGKTYYSQSEEYMDGAHTAFCEQADIAIEALKEFE